MMTSREAIDWLKRQNKRQNNGNGDLWLEMYINAIEEDLKVLEILKYRIHLKDATIRNETGKKVNVAFVEASGFVFKNSEEYKILKEWCKIG